MAAVLNIIYLLSAITASVRSVDSFKILLIFPIDSPSHDILGRGYVRELIKRGHEVTYMSAYPKENSSPNYTFFDLSYSLNSFELTKDMVAALLDDGENIFKHVSQLVPGFQKKVYDILKNEDMQAFLANPDNKFDLVVTEWLFTELLSGLSAIFQCPLVWSSSVDIHSGISRFVDDFINPSYATDAFIYEDVSPYNFLQRVKSLWIFLKNNYYWESYTKTDEEKYIEYYSAAAEKRGITLPKYEDLLHNGSMLMLNAHPSYSSSIRLPQNAKNVGGYHIEMPAKPLPDDLQKIMDESKKGVIYFSLGSVMKSALIPEQLKTSLLNLFSGLEQTVLWKLEEDIPNKPKNVHIRRWMPQQSILAHPNTKIFITHGGLLSTAEAVHYGVPLIGIPIFSDQFLNMRRSEQKGYARTVRLTWKLVDDLKGAISEILADSRYAETAKSLSEIYHLRPQPPGDELAFWLEYVIKTKGAPHLRSLALMLPWYRRYYVDLLVLVLSTIVIIISLIVFVFWKLVESKKKLKKN